VPCFLVQVFFLYKNLEHSCIRCKKLADTWSKLTVRGRLHESLRPSTYRRSALLRRAKRCGYYDTNSYRCSMNIIVWQCRWTECTNERFPQFTQSPTSWIISVTKLHSKLTCAQSPVTRSHLPPRWSNSKFITRMFLKTFSLKFSLNILWNFVKISETRQTRSHSKLFKYFKMTRTYK